MFPAEKAGSHANDYRSGIRSAIRGLWNGAIDVDQFTDVMQGVIARGLRFAFDEGAREVGINPDEYTEAETNVLQGVILSEYGYIGGLADDVIQNSKKNGGALEPLFARAELWINRYRDVVNRARVLVGQDEKLEWVFGKTEKHCGSCSKLNGKVKRASYWSQTGIQPRVPDAPYLECKGHRCDCELRPTKKPISKGPLPSLP